MKYAKLPANQSEASSNRRYGDTSSSVSDSAAHALIFGDQCCYNFDTAPAKWMSDVRTLNASSTALCLTLDADFEQGIDAEVLYASRNGAPNNFTFMLVEANNGGIRGMFEVPLPSNVLIYQYQVLITPRLIYLVNFAPVQYLGVINTIWFGEGNCDVNGKQFYPVLISTVVVCLGIVYLFIYLFIYYTLCIAHYTLPNVA